jgi:hypothetical protein
MGENPIGKSEKALKLEALQLSKATDEFNGACDAQVAQIVSDHAAKGGLRSGKIGTAIGEAHLARAKNIIAKALEIRKATIRTLPELAADPYFQKLTEDLERTAEQVCRSIPEHMARFTGVLVRGRGSLATQEYRSLRLKAHVRREVEIMRQEVELECMEKTPTTMATTTQSYCSSMPESESHFCCTWPQQRGPRRDVFISSGYRPRSH